MGDDRSSTPQSSLAALISIYLAICTGDAMANLGARRSQYPYTVARSAILPPRPAPSTSGSDATAPQIDATTAINTPVQILLASILASGSLDEISSGDNFSGVERYLKNQCARNVNDGEKLYHVLFK